MTLVERALSQIEYSGSRIILLTVFIGEALKGIDRYSTQESCRVCVPNLTRIFIHMNASAVSARRALWTQAPYEHGAPAN